MKIVIVGGGAIGRLFCSYLIKGKHEVVLIDTDPRVVAAMEERGVEFMARGEEDPDVITSYPVKVTTDASQVDSCELVLLLVKSTATASAIQNVKHLISPDSPVLCIQTGLGNLEVLKKYISEENIILGLTFLSATSLGGSKVRPGMVGKTYIGELSGSFTPRLEKVCKVFLDCGIQTQMAHRILGRLWSKVIVYSAINPVSSILRIPNGNLTAKMESVTLMKRLIDEGKRVAEARSIDLVYSDLYELLFDVCRKSANNLSSMMQDILNERPTEIDAQNGVLCRYAEDHGVAVPTHHTVIQLLKLLEHWHPGSL